MPRDSNGQFSLVPGTLVSTGDTILVSQHNPPFQDVAQALTNSLDRTGSGGMLADLAMGNNKVTGLAPGVDPTDAATVSQIGVSASIPVGAIFDYAGSNAPDGYFLCYGQAISRATYATLFAAIGTTYGTGDGSTTFNLPDCRGRVGVGKDNMGGSAASRVTSASGITGTTLGASGGAQTVTLTTAEMPAHTHSVSGTTNTTGSHTHSGASSGGPANVSGGVTNAIDFGSTGAGGSHSHTVTGTAASTGSGGAHNNMPPAIVFNKIIRVS